MNELCSVTVQLLPNSRNTAPYGHGMGGEDVGVTGECTCRYTVGSAMELTALQLLLSFGKSPLLTAMTELGGNSVLTFKGSGLG